MTLALDHPRCQRHRDLWLEELLSHAVHTVPRYHGAGVDLGAYPLVEKEDIIADQGSFISDKVSHLKPALLEALAKPQNFNNHWVGGGAAWRNDILIEGTTGTTGVPFRFPRTRQERSRIALGVWRQRKVIDPLASSRHFYPFFHRADGLAHPVDPFDATPENVDRLYRSLAASGIRWLHSFPGLILSHLRMLSDEALRGHPLRYVELSGVFPSSEVVAGIRQRLGAEMVNQFGCMEVLAVGYGRNASSFDVLAENVYVEIVDDCGQAIDAPGIPGRLAVTARHQRLFPFIRYLTGDLAWWCEGGIGRQFVLVNRSRDSEDPKWGSYRSGAHYFRVMLPKAFAISGLMPFRFLQIREEGESRFEVLTDRVANSDVFVRALGEVCRADPLTSDIVLSHLILDERALAAELQKKPRLFIPRSAIAARCPA